MGALQEEGIKFPKIRFFHLSLSLFYKFCNPLQFCTYSQANSYDDDDDDTYALDLFKIYSEFAWDGFFIVFSS